jgi:transposase
MLLMLGSLHALNLSPLSPVLQAYCSERESNATLKETGAARRQVTMGFPQKRPLRQLTSQEREELSQKATSEVEGVSTVKRARALLAVADGCSFTEAGRQVGMSRDGVSQLVERFYQRGVEALSIAPGRGRKPTYTSQDHEQILHEIQRHPTWDVDQCLIWSLPLLQKSLHAKGVLDISPRTIRRVLLAHGWKYQPTTRTWLPIDQGE